MNLIAGESDFELFLWRLELWPLTILRYTVEILVASGEWILMVTRNQGPGILLLP